MYFGPSISIGRRGVSYGDSDAQAFIAATGLTGTTEVNAVNNLVANLKSYGLWSKMKAIYPFVSDTVNLLSYTEDFSNVVWSKVMSASVTSNTFTAPNGTLTADTLTGTVNSTNPSTSNGSKMFYNSGTYSTIQALNNTITGSIYVYPTSAITIQLFLYEWGGAEFGQSYTLTPNTWQRISITKTFSGSTGNVGLAVQANANTFYIWGSQLEQASSASTYQYIATTPANRFVSQFKYNLKDARDLDAAFRLAFNGTWTYSKQGATPNGVNAYANTFLNPTSVGFTQTDTHISAYLKTDTNGAKVDIGGSYNLFMGARWANNYNYPINRGNNAVGTSANSIGYFLASRVDNIRDRMFKNGTNVTNFTGAAVSLDNQNIYIGASSASGPLYSDRQTAFNTIGEGLTDTEASNLYTSVQAFQTALARQI